MPTSPLPNWAVSLAPPPEPIVAVVSLVVVPLSSPQAARKAAIAVELPPTARKRRRDTVFELLDLSHLEVASWSFACPPLREGRSGWIKIPRWPRRQRLGSG